MLVQPFAQALHHRHRRLVGADLLRLAHLGECLIGERDHLAVRDEGELPAAGAFDLAATGGDERPGRQHQEGNAVAEPAQQLPALDVAALDGNGSMAGAHGGKAAKGDGAVIGQARAGAGCRAGGHSVGPLPGRLDSRGAAPSLRLSAVRAAANQGPEPTRRMGVQIILLSEHFRPPRDFIDDSWRGLREGVLFVPGSENEGFLLHPQRSILPKAWTSREELIRLVRRDGGNILLSHVEERFDWPTNELDGLEIYNHHTDFKDESGFLFWLRGAFTDPDRLKQAQELLANHPIEFFGATQDYLAPILQKWDRDLQSHPLTGVAANDCHHNLVYTIKALDAESIELHEIGDKPRRIPASQSPRVAEMLRGRAPGETIATLDMDPYDRSLGYVTTHFLLPELTEAAVRRALREGSAYVAHDWLCDPTGFAFIAERNGKRIGGMGSTLKQAGGLRLRLAAPAAGTMR